MHRDSEEIALWLSKVILSTDDINAGEALRGGTPINDSAAYAVLRGSALRWESGYEHKYSSADKNAVLSCLNNIIRHSVP